MLPTTFTRLVGCSAPVQMAAMGGLTSPPLIAAVAGAGGLGMLAAVQMPPAVITRTVAEIRAAAGPGRIGANFLMPFVADAGVEAAAASCDVVEFFYDTPAAHLVERVHRAGALAAWQIGSADEARQAQDAGCDFIIAQGVEAGGHVRGILPLLLLLDQVLGFAGIPVLAAGAVSTARGLAAVLAAGGAGVRVGSRFLTAAESPAHPHYIDALLAARADDTVLTRAFGNGWPDAPHRVLKACVEAAEAHPDDTTGTLVLGGQTIEVPRFNVMPPDRSASGNVAAMCLYAGQSVEHITRRQPAAEIVAELVAGAERQLRAAAPADSPD